MTRLYFVDPSAARLKGKLKLSEGTAEGKKEKTKDKVGISFHFNLFLSCM